MPISLIQLAVLRTSGPKFLPSVPGESAIKFGYGLQTPKPCLFLYLMRLSPATVDSFPGKEVGIVAIVCCTTYGIGPGFTNKPGRLNVMLSRSRSGMMIFGDINTFGNFDKKSPGKTPKNEGPGVVVQVFNDDNEPIWSNATMLYGVHKTLFDSKRCVTAQGPEKQTKDAARDGG